MPTTDPQLLAKLNATVEAAHAAFNSCPIGDPLKLELAKQRNKADNTYLKAINDGLSGNSAAIQQAAQVLDAANQAVKDALAASQKAAKVLAALQKAVGFAIQLAKLAAVVAV
jgi:hypothetical protein